MSTIKIQKKEIRKLDIICKNMTAKELKAKYNPDFFINLALYDTLSGKNITHIEDENVKSGYLFTTEGFGLTGPKNLIWTTKDKAFASTLIKDYVSGSPILVKKGKVKIEWGNKISDQVIAKRNRSVIGMNENEVIFIAIKTAVTLEQAAQMAVEAGCEFAINVDGGGSSHLEVGEKIYASSIRKNASWLLGWYNKPCEVPSIYVVQKGDTLSGIANKFGTTYIEIARKNSIGPPYLIRAGRKLKI